MPWYHISIKQKNIRKTIVGIRYYEEVVYQKVEKAIHDKANEKLGKNTIDTITITKLPVDHPAVLKVIKMRDDKSASKDHL